MPGNVAPAVHVDVAFGVPPLTRPGALDWVRVGQVRVRELTTSRGARIKTGEPETGEATATLDDLDGALDPTNTASPYAPDVLLRTRVRFVVEHAGGEDVIWTGFIKSLPLAWRREVAVCTLGAAGLLWLIATGPDLPPSVLHQTIVDSAPLAYWPLTEDSGGTADDVVGTRHGSWRLAEQTSTQQLTAHDPRPAQVFGLPSKESLTVQAVTVPGFRVPSTPITFGAWVRVVRRSTAGIIKMDPVLQLDTSDPNAFAWMGVTRQTATGPGILSAGVNNGADFAWIEAASGFPNLYDGAPHLLVLSVDPVAGTGFVAVDDATPIPLANVSATFPDLSGMVGPLWFGDRLPASAYPETSLDDPPQEWLIGHVAIWDRVLSAAEIAAEYEAGMNPWAGDRTGQRLGRILDVIGVDAGDRDIDEGIQVCSPALLGGNPGEYLRKLAATEAGTLFESADGKITFRQSIANNPAVVHTFSDDPAGDTGTAVGPVDPDYSTDRVINAATVTRENGSAQTARDATSIGTYGELSANLDTLHSTPSGARARAASLVIRNRNPKLVFPGVTADHIDTDAATLTGTDVGEAVTVIARPPRGGAPIDQTSIVERVGHRLAGGRWTVDFGVVEHLVLPLFSWDTPGQGWDESVWADL